MNSAPSLTPPLRMSKRPRRDDAWRVNTRAKKPRLSDNIDPHTLMGLLEELRKECIWPLLDHTDVARLSQTCHRASVEMRPWRVPVTWTRSYRPWNMAVIRKALELDMPRAGCTVRRFSDQQDFTLRFQRDDVGVAITGFEDCPDVDVYRVERRGRYWVWSDDNNIQPAIDFLRKDTH